MRLGGSPPGRNADTSFEQFEERDHPFGRASVLSEGGAYSQRQCYSVDRASREREKYDSAKVHEALTWSVSKKSELDKSIGS